MVCDSSELCTCLIDRRWLETITGDQWYYIGFGIRNKDNAYWHTNVVDDNGTDMQKVESYNVEQLSDIC